MAAKRTRHVEPGITFYAAETETGVPGVNKYVVKDPDLEIGGGPIIPEGPGGPVFPPDPNQPHPEHPIYFPPEVEPPEPPVIEAPVMAAILPSASTEPVPPSVELPEGSQRVVVYLGPGTMAFDWYMPPIATPKKR